jgi:hypothetical protein
MKRIDADYYISKVVLSGLRRNCTVQEVQETDPNSKLDFVISHFKELDRTIPVGVKITSKFNNFPVIVDFLKAAERMNGIQKYYYFEVCEDVGTEDKGAAIVYHSIMTLLSNVSYRDKKICGVRIEKNISFSIFDIEKTTVSKEPVAITKVEIENGRIRTYFNKFNWGYIKPDKGRKVISFSHKEVSDTNLANFLAGKKKPVEVLTLKVTFKRQRDPAGSFHAVEVKLAPGENLFDVPVTPTQALKVEPKVEVIQENTEPTYKVELTPEQVIKFVCEYYNVERDDLSSGKLGFQARGVVILVLRKDLGLTRASMVKFLNLSQATLISSEKKFQNMCKDEGVLNHYNGLRDKLNLPTV